MKNNFSVNDAANVCRDLRDELRDMELTHDDRVRYQDALAVIVNWIEKMNKEETKK